MKRLLFLTLALAMFGCSDDESTTTVNYYQGSIIGTWKTIEVYDGTATYQFEDCTNESDSLFSTYEFEENASYFKDNICGNETLDEYGTYTFADGIVTFKIDEDTESGHTLINLGNNKVKLLYFTNSANDKFIILEKQ